MEVLRVFANRSDLLEELKRVADRLQSSQSEQARDNQPGSLFSACQRPRQRLLSTRFTYDDVASMIAKYDSGIPARIIADEHQIGLTSLKRLIRERGARRKDQSRG